VVQETMKYTIALHPRNEIAYDVAEEVFNPEAGKASDNPFGEHVAPSEEPLVAEQEDPSEEAASNQTVSELDDESIKTDENKN